MRFWDTSALVPLLLEEPRSASMRHLLEEDPVIASWWGTPVEIGSALARCEREDRLDGEGHRLAQARLEELGRRALEIQPVDSVRQRAHRLLRVHPLRAAEALQLAAALAWCEDHPGGAAFVTLDARLAEAARREGFRVEPDSAAPAP